MVEQAQQIAHRIKVRHAEELVLAELRLENAKMKQAIVNISHFLDEAPKHIYKNLAPEYIPTMTEGWCLVEALRGIKANIDLLNA